MIYAKPPISIPEQIAKLKSRGLAFQDESKAAHYLSNISYYRLRAYTYPFQDNVALDHPFVKRVSFEEILQLYVFDRQLRLLIFDGLEKIEIALRTKIIYHFSLSYGSHWHEDQFLYRNHVRFARDLSKLYEEVDRSPETFIQHYKQTYSSPQYPPSWMSLEVALMGLLSKMFANLKKGKEKAAVTRDFGLTRPEILESWIHSFSDLRNICAHHGRIWNRRLTTTPQIPYNTIHPFLNDRQFQANKIYGTLCCMTYVLAIIGPGNSFNEKLRSLMRNRGGRELKEMGFTERWREEVVWK